MYREFDICISNDSVNGKKVKNFQILSNITVRNYFNDFLLKCLTCKLFVRTDAFVMCYLMYYFLHTYLC